MDIKATLKANKVKIGVVVGAVVVVAIGLFVGDITLADVAHCVTSLDLKSAACVLITGSPATP